MKMLLVGEGNHELGGALKYLVERLIGRAIDPDQRRWNHASYRQHAQRGETRYAGRARAWIRTAQKEGFAALVLLIDRDGDDHRRRQFDEVQGDPAIRQPRALGVAVEEFDAWMLADEQALGGALNLPKLPRQPAPENVKDPKELCESLRPGVSWREVYATIGNRASLELIEKRCPKGFAPFAARVRALRDVNPTVAAPPRIPAPPR
ncbi:MAG: hypothetical protein U1D55_09950 [Phycisphaerae bacterium]